MKIPKLIIALNMILLVIFSAGCLPKNLQNSKTLVSPPSPSNTIQVTATRTLYSTKTKTVFPTTTNTNTGIRPTRTPTSTPFPFTVYPTLDYETYQANLQNWRASQIDCSFPCLWDIRPGKSDIDSVWKTVHEILPDQFCKYESNGFSCSFSNHTFSHEYRIPSYGLSVKVKNNQIEQINLSGDFSNKSLRMLILELGYPDDAFLNHVIGGEGWAESSLLLTFNNYQTVAEFYKGIRMTNNSSLVFCLNDLDYSDIELYPEGKQISFSNLAYYAELPYQSFSDAVGIEFSDYYKKYATNDGTLCIFSYQDIWRQ